MSTQANTPITDPAVNPDATPLAPPIDLSVVLKRCGGDAKFAAAVTERFRTQAIAEVGRIEQALASGDAAVLGRSAHNLKSMSSYMGAETSSDLARKIEDLARTNQLSEVLPLLVRLSAEIGRATAWITESSAVSSKCA